MENNETKIERVEQNAQQRPRELGDQLRSEEKARELIGARDKGKRLDKATLQHTDSVNALSNPQETERQKLLDQVQREIDQLERSKLTTPKKIDDHPR